MRRNNVNKTSSKSTHRKQFELARLVLDGYPILSRIMTKEEQNHYFSGDKIDCLLCGKQYQLLHPKHLVRIHGITPDQYRERYGLPYGKGLCSKVFADRQSILSKERGFGPTEENRQKAHQAIRDGKMRTNSLHRSNMRENLKNVPKNKKWDVTLEVNEVIRIAKTMNYSVEKSIRYLNTDKIFISRSVFYDFLKRNPEYKSLLPKNKGAI